MKPVRRRRAPSAAAWRRTGFAALALVVLAIFNFVPMARAGAPVRAAAPQPSGVRTAALVPAAPPGCSKKSPIFLSDFNGPRLNRADWNPYITSRAANGKPWNSNGREGSSSANPDVDLDAEYDLPSSLRVDRGLQITARRTPTPGDIGAQPAVYPWRSGTVSTYGRFEFEGGCVSVEAKMPTAAGMWPGLWMLPGPRSQDGDNFEIDLFEGGSRTSRPAHSYSWHLHTPDGSIVGGVADVGANLAAGYHLYSLDWDPGRSITWYFDGRRVSELTSAEATIPTEPMELIISLQVANDAAAAWHTVPGAVTPQSAVMSVRAVAVYR